MAYIILTTTKISKPALYHPQTLSRSPIEFHLKEPYNSLGANGLNGSLMVAGPYLPGATQNASTASKRLVTVEQAGLFQRRAGSVDKHVYMYIYIYIYTYV